MGTRKIFIHNILKVYKNSLLLVNKHELNILIYIIRDNQEQFLMKKRRFYILKD